MDTLTQPIVDACAYILNLFPTSPVQSALAALDDSGFSTWIGWLNWFMPVGTWLGILEAWLLAIGLYYVYQIALRWIKAIE